MTIESFINTYYLPYYVNKTYNPLNLKKWEYLIGVIMKYDLVKMEIRDVKKHDIIAFLLQCESERDVSKATLNRYKTCLSGVFSYAVENDILEINPIKKIKKYKEYPRRKFLTVNEALVLLMECKKSRNKELYPIVVLALNTGMRQGEILKLKSNRIKNQIIQLDGRDTKTGEGRIVPLNKCAMSVIHEQQRSYRSEYLFQTKSTRNAFETAVARAGLQGLWFHDLRRTFATHMKDANIDIHTISKVLGHTNISTTERYLGLNEAVFNSCVQSVSFI